MLRKTLQHPPSIAATFPELAATYSLSRCNTLLKSLHTQDLFVLFVCLFVGIKPEKTILHLLFLEGSETPGSDRTRTQALLRA